ncbi:ABC transporter permease subunit [Kroppenstedtia pulmonis]|uniref:ABC transporter permease subunit n=1 Tax=Kroppenstedtia pulmonis TaxID=1380685 RepID=A0A7D4CEJ0_9BACL|nr:ABC transporter permease [Kroppenstedtia pulmonis]QKG83914.1 ABC transporter permease subunit [Kroppenstedtia pulmonis]
MLALIRSEWERLWCRKLTWLLFGLIPVMTIAGARYMKGEHAHLSPDKPQYAVFHNFPVLALAEMLITAVNLILILWLIVSMTQEYRTGQLRMVMLRSYSPVAIFSAKWLTVIAALFLYLAVFFMVSYITGWFLLPKTESLTLFYHPGTATGWEAFWYNLQYYGMAFITLIVMSSIIMCIAVASPTSTTAIGISLGFVLVSFGYIHILQMFTMNYPVHPKWYYLSLVQIQYEGITLLLAVKPMLGKWISMVLATYGGVFMGTSWLLVRRQDRFM